MHPEVQELTQRLPVLNACAEQIEASFAILRDAFAGGRKALICGNGGSAADAEHWAGELLKGFRSRRCLGIAERAGLDHEIAERLQGALPMIPLTGFLSLATAFGNDVDPQLIFAQLVWALGAPGDAWIGISTSGNAKNVIAAAKTARARGIKTIGLTAAGGGELAGLVDVCIRVPADSTHLAQELHLPVYHALCVMLEREFFPDADTH